MTVLDELVIRDLGVIEHVELQLAPGLTVVTGETGTGKTMVVAALELLLGARADATRIRSGAKRAVIDARFVPPPEGSLEWISGQDDDLVVSREVASAADGVRSRARIGGGLAPISALQSLLGNVIEIHGQDNAHRLNAAGMQRELLDRFGGETIAAARSRYGGDYSAYLSAVTELRELRERAHERARDMDRLEAELAEIRTVAPERGEDDAIDAQLQRAEHVEALSEAARRASSAIVDEGGARDTLGAAVGALRAVSGIDELLTTMTGRVEVLASESQDLAMELSDYAQGLGVDADALDALRARRVAVRSLTRKYGEDTDAVLAYAAAAEADHARLRVGDERVQELERSTSELFDKLTLSARRLHDDRENAASALADTVHGHLADLAMAEAVFAVEVTAIDPGPTGADVVTFVLAANPGEPSLPLAKAASGGERSRVALAVRLALTEADDSQVLVFDEVDAGVGGAVALAIGEKLARLAEGRQVLCVTHLAQLAAFAHHHFVVRKETRDGRTQAFVNALNDDQRIVELSRLLSGGPHGGVAADHAAQLRADCLKRLAS